MDGDEERGQFVMAGSLRFLSVPGITESLAGRAGVLEVWPFSQGELAGVTEHFIDLAFANPEQLRDLPPSPQTRKDYFERICAGGYPEPLAIQSPRVRSSWYDGYLTNVIERDLREVARIREDSAAESMLRYLASTIAQELNITAVSNKTGFSAKTVRRYLDLLRTAFLIHRVPARSRNVTAKVVKHPNVHLTDTGVAAHLLSLNAAALARPVAPCRGALLETFVVNELAKQRVWSETDARIHLWRDRSGLEVDIVPASRRRPRSRRGMQGSRLGQHGRLPGPCRAARQPGR
ncbi:ATP-binding protein [Streptomyces boninensis]|uniref:ATP-binding protein n=1 Tax=Streptomyces boninensis TaxID=2039455 RepID=UPI003B214022